jgi:hypothetical protein
MRQADTIEQALRLLQEEAARSRAPAAPPLGAFRVVCASVCAIIAVVFLSINTVLLARFGYKLGTDEIEQWSQAIIAGTIPWALALLPFILLSTWVPGHYHQNRRGRTRWRRGRPSFATVSACVLYVVLVAVNFIGGVGVMATARQHVAGKAHDAASEETRLNDARARLNKELDGIGKHRPADEVAALLSRQQQHAFWRATSQCSQDAVSTRAHTRYCADYDLLKAELARAKQGTEVRQQLTALDQQLSSPIRAQIVADDAQTQVLARNLRISEQSVRDVLPLMWPLLLELGSLLMAYFALKLFRIDHSTLVDPPSASSYVPVARQLAAEAIPLRAETVSVGTRSSLTGDDPVSQRATFDAFWGTRLRWVDHGQVPESQIYSHYQTFCAQRQSSPLDIGTFRRLSAERSVQTIDLGGSVWWCGVALSGT